MPHRPLTVLALALAALAPAALPAQPPAPTGNEPTARDVAKSVSQPSPSGGKNDPVERIKDEGLNRSQVMATLGHLTDVIGPRLTGSTGLKRANEWTRDTLAGWGLREAHLEPWGPFGRGWTLRRFSAQIIEPQCIPLIAYPKAWSPGTDGLVVAEVVSLDAKTEADLARYKGTLRGKAVLISPPTEIAARFEPLATRLTDTDLLRLADASEAGGRPFPAPRSTGSAAPSGPGPRPRGSRESRAEQELARKRLAFLVAEGAAVVLEPSRQGDGGTLFVTAAAVPAPEGGKRLSPWSKDAPATVPQLVVAKEHYNRMARMIRSGEALKLTLDLAVRFDDDDPMAYNTVAEIPGTDLKDEVVMLGAHLDSWHGGTGATDNAAGVAVAMEAVRILRALKLQPRRTVRIALWTGEEQGLLGSKAYVAAHFGKADGGATPSAANQTEAEKFSAYFNIDNGTGKVRGVYLQGNEAVRPIFRRWLAPFRDLGATTLSFAGTGGTDHTPFDAAGLPGFQFIQDVIEYNTRTHHSNQDVLDRIQGDDLKQASVIMAAFVYQAAARDERLPRKPRAGR